MFYLGRILFILAGLFWVVEAWASPGTGVPDQTSLRVGQVKPFNPLNNDTQHFESKIVDIDVPPGLRGKIISSGKKIEIRGLKAGSFKIKYYVEDIHKFRFDSEITVRVLPNAHPVAGPLELNLNTGQTGTINILSASSDPDKGDQVTFENILKPATGITVSDPVNNIVTVKASDTPGVWEIEYSIKDKYGLNGGNILKVMVSKALENKPPIARPDEERIKKGETRILRPLDNDEDPEGEVLRIVGSSYKNSLNLIRNRDETFTVNPSETGTFPIQYEIADPKDARTSSQIMLTVYEDNQAPIAESFELIVQQGQTSQVNVISGAKDPEGHKINLTGTTGRSSLFKVAPDRASGTISITGLSLGADSFVYTIEDEKGASGTGTIQITVKQKIPTCDIKAPTLSTTISKNSAKTIEPLEGLSCPGQTLVVGPTPNGKSGVYFSKSANGYEISTGSETGTFSFPYTIAIGPVSKSGTINVTVKDSVQCLRTSRLRGYLPMIDRMSSGLPGELSRLETLIANLPDDVFAPVSVPDYCPIEIHNRARDLQSRLDALVSGGINRESLATTREKVSELIETMRQHLYDIDDIRNNMAICVDPDTYKEWDNKLGALMENASALEQAADNIRPDLNNYQSENLNRRGLNAVRTDIDRLNADVQTQCKLPLVIVHNSYDFEPGESKIIDPLGDDYDPNMPAAQRQRLKIASFDPAPGALASGASYLVAPPFFVERLDDHSFRITAGQQPGDFEFEIKIENPYGEPISSLVKLSLTKPEPVENGGIPWWVWPLGGGLVVMGGLIAFLLKGRATAAPVEAASTTTRIAGRASESLRRIFRTDLKFRKDEGVPFGKSPLIATVTEPGPEPKLPVGHEIPAGLATLTGPFFVLREAYRATGRIGFAQEGVPTNDDVSLGTGFVIAPNLIMTNQHVYQAYKHYLEGDECGGIEFIAERDRDASDYYEFDGNPPIVLPDLDIAIFRTKKKIIGRKPLNRVYVPTDDLLERDVIVVGYPCPFEVDDYILSLVEPDPIFAIKRVTQGKVFRHSTDSDGPFGILFKVDALINGKEEMAAVCHNATTLAGNSGSPVLCAKTGKLLGVHFAGSRSLFGQEAANLAMAIEAILEKEEEEEF